MYAKSVAQAYYPRWGRIDLDLPPRLRWNSIILRYKDETITHLREWRKSLDARPEVDQAMWARELRRRVAPELQAEVEGIADAAQHPDVTVDLLLLFGAMYELGAPVACSQIIAATPDGTVVHGRNLDFHVVSPLIELTFISQGKDLFSAPTFLGSVGFHTALKHGCCSIAQNGRTVYADTPAKALQFLQSGGRVYTWFLRNLLEQSLSYNQMVERLKTTPLLRAQYFVIAGREPYQGTVVTRYADPKYTKVDQLNQALGIWRLVQTNDDIGTRPVDSRRMAGIQSMVALTQANVSPNNIANVMMTPPLYTSSNVFLFVMVPKNGFYCEILGPQVPNDDRSVTCPLRETNPDHNYVESALQPSLQGPYMSPHAEQNPSKNSAGGGGLLAGIASLVKRVVPPKSYAKELRDLDRSVADAVAASHPGDYKPPAYQHSRPPLLARAAEAMGAAARAAVGAVPAVPIKASPPSPQSPQYRGPLARAAAELRGHMFMPPLVPSPLMPMPFLGRPRKAGPAPGRPRLGGFPILARGLLVRKASADESKSSSPFKSGPPPPPSLTNSDPPQPPPPMPPPLSQGAIYAAGESEGLPPWQPDAEVSSGVFTNPLGMQLPLGMGPGI